MAKKFIQSVKRGISESKTFKVVRNKYFIVTVFFLAWILFLDTNNVFVWMRDMGVVSDQQKQKEYYKEAIRQTDEKLKELTSNKDSLEKFAREQYLFHEKDEEVFLVVEEEQ
jgi:cell division protein FtsB